MGLKWPERGQSVLSEHRPYVKNALTILERPRGKARCQGQEESGGREAIYFKATICSGVPEVEEGRIFTHGDPAGGASGGHTREKRRTRTLWAD